MRRRLERFLPIVLIALLVQLLAPIGASWAMGRALSDPFGASPICSVHAADQGGSGQHNQSSPQGDHGNCCMLCCMGQVAAVSLDDGTDRFSTPFRSPRRIVWSDAALTLPSLTDGFHAQARAPPFMS